MAWGLSQLVERDFAVRNLGLGFWFGFGFWPKPFGGIDLTHPDPTCPDQSVSLSVPGYTRCSRLDKFSCSIRNISTITSSSS